MAATTQPSNIATSPPDAEGETRILARYPAWAESLAVGVLFTVWSLIFRGFDGGRWSDIPIYKSFVDPSLYANDPFIGALHDGTPAAYTYVAVAQVARLLSWLTLDQTLFLLYLPASIASLALLYALARSLIAERISAGVFLLLYVAGFRLLTIGSTLLHSAETTPAFLALPFQVGGLLATLRGRLWLAGLALGIGLDIHTPTTALVALAVGAAWLTRIRITGLREPLIAGLALMVVGAPAILGAVLQHGDTLPLWALYLAKAELATDISTAVHFETWHLRLRNGLGLALLVAAVLAARPLRHSRALLGFFAAVVAMCLLALLFFDLSLRTPLSTLVARLQFPRSVWLVNVIGLIYVAHLLCVGWRNGWAPRPVLLATGAAMLIAPTDFLPWEPLWPLATLAMLGCLAAHRFRLPAQRLYAIVSQAGLAIAAGLIVAGALVGRRIPDLDLSQGAQVVALACLLVLAWGLFVVGGRRAPIPLAAATALGVALVSAAGVRAYDAWQYQGRHSGGLRAAAEFQTWARTSTPVDSVFLLLPSEPNNNSFYKNAERSIFLDRERANQAVYFRQHNIEFRTRLEALGIDDPVAYKVELDRVYRRLTEDQVRELAGRFGVTHFVPARAGDFNFPIVYQSGGWTVYAVRA